jgi:hypothetical protein
MRPRLLGGEGATSCDEGFPPSRAACDFATMSSPLLSPARGPASFLDCTPGAVQSPRSCDGSGAFPSSTARFATTCTR